MMTDKSSLFTKAKQEMREQQKVVSKYENFLRVYEWEDEINEQYEEPELYISISD